MENMRMELNLEELEQVNGGWNIFDPFKKAVKSVGNFIVDGLVKPVANGVGDIIGVVADPEGSLQSNPEAHGVEDLLKECMKKQKLEEALRWQ